MFDESYSYSSLDSYKVYNVIYKQSEEAKDQKDFIGPSHIRICMSSQDGGKTISNIYITENSGRKYYNTEIEEWNYNFIENMQGVEQ